MKRTSLSILAVLALSGCASSAEQSPFTAMEYSAIEYADNELTGQFWSPAEQQLVSWNEVINRLPSDGWLLLGEQHDHPDHHRIQALFIQFLAEQGELGTVAMEMIATDQQRAVDTVFRSDAEPTAEALNWQSGWPWEHYQAQVRVALLNAERVVAGDLSDSQKAAVRAEPEQIEAYNDEHTQYLAQLIVDSHCGMFGPEQALPAVSMQIARDQFMASQLAQYAVDGKTGVFIAGSGHVRADYGVPLWLPEDLPVLSIIIQAVGESTDPNDYLSQRFAQHSPADLVLFVPALPYRDYCAELMEHFSTAR